MAKTSAESAMLRISKAAQAAGVSKQTLEYYVMLGLVRPRQVPGKKGRYFDAALVKRVRLIHQLNRSGYTLQEIRETYLRGK